MATICPSSAPPAAALRMLRGVACRAEHAQQLGYLPHHPLCCLKESATFALGLNYVQFTKMGLKPLRGGGKALWPIYQCSVFLPVTGRPKQKDTARERGRERKPQRHGHTCAMMDWDFSFCYSLTKKKNPNIQTTKPAAVFVSSVPTIARYLSTRPALFQ